MFKPKKAVLGLALVGALGGFVAVQSTTQLATLSQPAVAHAATTVNAKTQGMVADNATDNAPKLQAIIDAYSASDDVTIHVPKGTYLFTNDSLKAIKLHSNITFDFDDGAVFRIAKGDRMAFAYPSPAAGYDGGISNVTWKNATFRGTYTKAGGQAVFVQSLNHASNVTFDDCTFDNCESPTGHYIDIDGSHNIDIQNSTFTGFNASTDYDYKEAIQVDYSNTKAMSYHNSGDKYDDLPSYDVTVNNNKFIPLSTSSGSVKSFAPNPIGQHAVYKKGVGGIIHDIKFTNNYVEDAKPLLDDDGANIHFVMVNDLTISGNTFVNKKALGSGNYIRILNNQPKIAIGNIAIKNNKFVNLDPNNRYIFFDTKAGGGISNVTVTGNKITSSKANIPFVITSGMTSSDIKISGNTNNKSTSISNSSQLKNTSKLKAAKTKSTLSKKYTGHKKTNKKQAFYKGVANQYAKLKTGANKKYGLYSHIKGDSGWYVYNKTDGWAKKKSNTVYVDGRATASSGNWYRIRFSSSTNARRYWIRAGALTFDKITYDDYNKTLTTLKNYTVYTRVFNDKLLAKTAGTTATLSSRTVNITKRARRVSVINHKTSTYYQINGKYWTRALAFY